MPKTASVGGRVLRQEISIDEQPGKPGPQAPPPEKLDFWERLRRIKPEEWGSPYVVYLYRREPRTSMAAMGGYLDRIESYFEEADVAETYGGYEFEALLRDRKTNQAICAHKFRIEAPPKYSTKRGEMPQNRMESGQATPAPQQQDSQVAGRLVDMLDDRIASLERMIRENPGAQTPSFAEQFTMLKQTAEMMRAGQPSPSSTSELAQTLEILSKLQRPQQESTIEKKLTDILLERVLQPPPNPLKQLESLLTLAKTLGIEVGAGGGGGKRSLAEMAVEALPTVMDKGVQLIREVGNTAARVRQMPPGPGARPAPGTNGAPPVAAIAAPAAEIPGLAPVDVIGEQAPERGSLPWLYMRVVEMIRMEVSGATIIDFIEESVPAMVQDMGQVSRADLQAFFHADPILQQATALPRFQRTLDEAHAYLTSEAGEEDDREAPPLTQ